MNILGFEFSWQIHAQNCHAKLQPVYVIAQKHDLVIAQPDGLEKRVTISERTVVEGNCGFVSADQVTIQYAVFILVHWLCAATFAKFRIKGG
jgi:hypothetical protein